MKNNKLKKNILVTGIGGAVAYQVLQCINLNKDKYRTFATETNPNNAYIYQNETIDKIYITPPAAHPLYFEKLNEICERESIDYAFITNEIEIDIHLKQPEKFNYKILLPENAYFNIFHSKYDTYKILNNNVDIKLVPNTILLNNVEDIKNAFSEYGSALWVRASIGQAAQTAYKAENLKQAKLWVTLKNGFGKYTASEFLPGKNLAWTSLYYKNELICSTVHERISYFNSLSSQSGVTGIATALRTLHRLDVCQVSEKAINTIIKEVRQPLSGIITIDLKEDSHGSPLVTEINPRPTNTYHLAKAGCNFATLLIEVADGGRPSLPKYNACRASVYFLRNIDCPPVIIDEKDLFKKFGDSQIGGA